MRVPVAGGAWLLEELDPGGIEGFHERDAFVGGVALVRVDPDASPTGHGALHGVHALPVADGVDADLDLDRPESRGKKLLEFSGDRILGLRIEQSQHRDADCLAHLEGSTATKHF